MGSQRRRERTTRRGLLPRLRTKNAQEQLFRVNQVDASDEKDEVSADGEPEGDEDDEYTSLEPERDAWGSTSSPPLISELPYRARPYVCYRIDEQLEVHSLEPRQYPLSALRLLIAKAVARHILSEGVSLSKPGDWCQIPLIRDERRLLELVEAEDDSAQLASMLHSVGSDLKAFAILLPSGDVVTPQALINEAQKNKRATRAAALRLAAERPSQLAGEPWSAQEWERFETTQRSKGNPGRGGGGKRG
jgi:hypothetical protein